MMKDVTQGRLKKRKNRKQSGRIWRCNTRM